MNFKSTIIAEKEIEKILNMSEDHFNDLKGRRISPSKLSECISSFANASGGDIYLGIEELDKNNGVRTWNGFEKIEDANAFVQMIDGLTPLANNYDISFLEHPILHTFVIQISIMKSGSIVFATNDIPYIRRGAQKLPVDTPEKLRRLELDKGIVQFENEPVAESSITDLTESKIFADFMSAIIPNVEKHTWIQKQKLCKENVPTVAGILLFAEEPQITLPKRSAIKVFRYKTSGIADRDMLATQPLSIEGCAYDQIYSAVRTTKEIIESMKKLGEGFEAIQYPEETLHEIITNAVIHRDYSIATDIQIRIFDNRIEVESPGNMRLLLP